MVVVIEGSLGEDMLGVLVNEQGTAMIDVTRLSKSYAFRSSGTSRSILVMKAGLINE